MSQLETISDTTGTVAGYKYLSLGRIVVEDNVEASTRLSYLDEDGELTRLDRFGRVVDQVWEQYDQYGTNKDTM
jgi:hypothetical protein